MGARWGAQSARLLVNADIGRSCFPVRSIRPERAWAPQSAPAPARNHTGGFPASREQGGAAPHPLEPPLAAGD